MAMYYYASKLSAVACGTRCRQGFVRKHRNRNANNRNSPGNNGIAKKKDDNDEPDGNEKDKKTLSALLFTNSDDPNVISVKTSEQPEVCCESTPTLTHTALGSGGVMYGNGNIVSGPLESLIDLLMPANDGEELDQEYVFSFLLSCRFFIRTHELLGKLLETVPDPEPLDRLVPLLGVWTRKFPYDFRDERMMNHVKHIVARCADTKLADVVSELLCALLARLTELEKHEEELKSYQSTVDNKTEPMKWPSASQLAQVLCRIERNLARNVGPEEFVQCNANLLKDPNREDFTPRLQGAGTIGGGTTLDGKKTCNLESYLEWSARLRLLVANEILKSQNIQDRNHTVELWSGAAQYCLLVGNYNSATTILESLDIPPIARLQITWSKLSTTTSQQLDCMQRHAEGCGNLWSKQTEIASGGGNGNGRGSDGASDNRQRNSSASSVKSGSSKPSKASSSNEWVVVPVFVDIVKLALKSREDCCVRLPNGHINMTAFDRLAAIVGAFTKHMCQVNQTLPELGEFAGLGRHMQSCQLLNESELMLASFECESPTTAEKELYDVT
ncbi:ras-GEF domain-containing family member 1B isoform X2 [Uranotaenia lowii]|uniref:ras-GEF domain-containing family member 1B isoform X2 n=1 Tax=Uranotaenia lowii TaxID=190385 RepID=UPI002478E26E|nr:ras-GEF domain-containing family member 1B isoform X2 [Uranotaenia lowii]